jgi:hypothetical protein
MPQRQKGREVGSDEGGGRCGRLRVDAIEEAWAVHARDLTEDACEVDIENVIVSGAHERRTSTGRYGGHAVVHECGRHSDRRLHESIKGEQLDVVCSPTPLSRSTSISVPESSQCEGQSSRPSPTSLSAALSDSSAKAISVVATARRPVRSARAIRIDARSGCQRSSWSRNATHVDEASARPRLRAAATPLFGCLMTSASTPCLSAFSAESSVEPSSTTMTSMAGPRCIARDVRAESR